ncbi:SEC-C metal-binding domain-containing protein [Chitinophaga silvisoli]
MLKSRSPLRTGKCFCESGLKYRHCHRSAYQQLNQLPKEELLKDD